MKKIILFILVLISFQIALGQKTEKDKVICPVCIKLELKSRVYIASSSTTLIPSIDYYDEEGNYHYEITNRINITYYACAQGHKFTGRYTFGYPMIEQFTVTDSTTDGFDVERYKRHKESFLILESIHKKTLRQE